MNERLAHDIAWSLAGVDMELSAHAFREEEHPDLFAAFYTAARAALEQFVLLSEREAKRLHPSKN